ncbi:MAG TPA: zinc-binding dehydrogenase, partial [Thermoanaerobaculia bacterium]|nr:zinc-binding dehydrogenase [Thermoanaerobaculia bacterium]
FWGAFLKRDAMRTREHLGDLVELFTAGKLKPAITQIYPLDRAADALMDLAERRVKGKIVIVPSKEST